MHERLIDKARRHDVLMAGPMSMGFHNFADGVRVFGFETRGDHRAGGVALVTQSGSVINALVDCESRIDFILVVSTGMDAGVTIADYVDFAVNMPSTRVPGVFIEAIRDVQTFRRALQTAKQRGIPVVALKVGRSQQAARFVTSHSGVMVGQDGAFFAARRGLGRCHQGSRYQSTRCNAARLRSARRVSGARELAGSAPARRYPIAASRRRPIII